MKPPLQQAVAKNSLPSPNNPFEKRLSLLRELLSGQNCDAVLLSDALSIAYLTGYFGFSPLEREAYLLITQKYTFIFTDARYTEAIRKSVPHAACIESTADNPFFKNLAECIKETSVKRLGFDEESLTAAEYRQLKPLTTCTPFDTRKLRQIKSASEIACIQKACRIGEKAFGKLLETIPEGVREDELAQLLASYIREQGADLSFPTIVAFGQNAAVPHHLTDKTKLRKKDIVLIDFGVLYQGYCSDMTRTFFVGEPNDLQFAAYEATDMAQRHAVQYIQTCLATGAEIKASEVDKKARETIVQAGFPTIPHAVGHGIGLAVHEAPTLSPRSKDVLTEGMVFSIEPGVYLPGKFGIRIEDLFAIQNNKLIRLSSS